MKVRKKTKAVVLLSGGLDSTTVLAIAQSRGFTCNCLSFHYGQRQSIELERARAIARQAGVARHLVLRVDLDAIGGSALTADIEVPKDRPVGEMEKDIPVTYVPGRNIIFLAHALSWAEVLGASDIFLGINAVDYSGYPDCRPEYLQAFADAVMKGTRAGQDGKKIEIKAPLIRLSKKDIVLLGERLGVPFEQTWSCYEGGDAPCGFCDACLLRAKGFSEAGVPEPVH